MNKTFMFVGALMGGIGVALGAIVAGVRVLLGFDQPYLDR